MEDPKWCIRQFWMAAAACRLASSMGERQRNVVFQFTQLSKVNVTVSDMFLN